MSALTPVYVLPRTDGATETTEWRTFCHSKEPFIVISSRRFTKNYAAERKRRFCVEVYHRGHHRFPLVSREHWFSTLAKAQAFAAELAKG